MGALDTDILRNMGSIIMFCYQRNITIGRRFDEALFRAIFSLTREEINAQNLPFAAQLKMMKAILQSRDVNVEIDPGLQHLQAWVDGNINWQQAYQTTQALYLDTPEDFDANNPDHQQAVIEALKGIYEEQYKFTEYLTAMQCIARGICAADEQFDWRQEVWQTFSDRVQGSLNRQFIVDRIRIQQDANQHEAIRQKTQWLKEWILDENTTDDKVREFIKFATGSSSLSPNDHIDVATQAYPYFPVPKAHSCFNRIDISPVEANYGEYHDRTKEGFIQSLENLMTEDYQMA